MSDMTSYERLVELHRQGLVVATSECGWRQQRRENGRWVEFGPVVATRFIVESPWLGQVYGVNTLIPAEWDEDVRDVARLVAINAVARRVRSFAN